MGSGHTVQLEILRLTESTVRLDTKPALLRLEELFVDRDLHVQGGLHLQQFLVVLHLLVDILQRLLDLGILRVKLK